MSEPTTRVQIFRFVTRDRVFEIADMLSIEAKQSRLAFTMLEISEDYRVQGAVRHFVSASDFKLVCFDLLHRTFDEWTDRGGALIDAETTARVLHMRRDHKYKMPYVLKMDNGIGENIGNGIVQMVRATDSLTLLLSEFDVRKMAQTVLDYIHDFEIVNFRKRQEAQTAVIMPEGGVK